MPKTTKEIVHSLCRSDSLRSFLQENASDLSHQSLLEHLEGLLREKHLTKADVINRANLATSSGYHIFAGEKAPSRDKVISLAVGFGLNLDESQQLLKYAGHRELYAREKRDSILIFCLNHHYNIVQVNETLASNGLKDLT